MSDRLDPEQLAELLDLPEDDPRRRAAEADPRVQARLRAYREFVSPVDMPEGAQLKTAEDHLGRMLERELGVTLAPEPGAVGTPPVPGPSRGVAPRSTARPRSGWWALLFQPSLRPALALAGLVVVAGGAWLVATMREPESPVMRDATPSLPDGGFAGVAEPERLSDGALRLSWSAEPEADAYAVVFLSPDLTEIARVADVRDTHLDLRTHELPAGLVPGRLVLWRVLALRGPDEIASTSALPLTLP